MRLWDRCYVPGLKRSIINRCGPIRMRGARSSPEMLERLYFADLVMADMTIANGNVYYEVGIRHAAKKTGCVMFAANWSQQLFDVAQMPQPSAIRCPKEIYPRATAATFQAAVKDEICGLASGDLPMRHLAIPGYPIAVDPTRCLDHERPVGRSRGFPDEGSHGPGGGSPRSHAGRSTMSLKR